MYTMHTYTGLGLALLLTFVSVQAANNDPLNVLPKDIAEPMQWCAWHAGWTTSNERYGFTGEATADKTKFEDYAIKFTKAANGLIPEEVCDDIKLMFFNVGWVTANERYGYDQSDDQSKADNHYSNIEKSKQFSKTLLDNISELGWAASWHAANTRAGHDEDAIGDKAKFESYAGRIAADVKLVAVNFEVDSAKLLKSNPKVVGKIIYNNDGDEPQTQAFSVEFSKGKTTSYTKEVSFTYGLSISSSVSFSYYAADIEASVEASFEYTSMESFTEENSEGTTVSYEWDITVPAKSIYRVTASIHEAEMEIPYEMVFDFDGSKRSFNGKWKGVAVSTATTDLVKCADRQCNKIIEGDEITVKPPVVKDEETTAPPSPSGGVTLIWNMFLAIQLPFIVVFIFMSM